MIFIELYFQETVSYIDKVFLQLDLRIYDIGDDTTQL